MNYFVIPTSESTVSQGGNRADKKLALLVLRPGISSSGRPPLPLIVSQCCCFLPLIRLGRGGALHV